MPGISIHVVDVVRGLPAIGMRIEVHALPAGGSHAEVGSGCIGADGQVDHPMVLGTGVRIGVHELLLHAGDFYRTAGILPRDGPAFLEAVAFRFTVGTLEEHYHLPFKISPWGLSVWRGR